MNKTRTVTTVFEYDKDGKVIKETRTEYEYEWQPAPVYTPPTWSPQGPYWWQQPGIMLCGSSYTSDQTVLINSVSN